jgi:hypothetical protein
MLADSVVLRSTVPAEGDRVHSNSLLMESRCFGGTVTVHGQASAIALSLASYPRQQASRNSVFGLGSVAGASELYCARLRDGASAVLDVVDTVAGTVHEIPLPPSLVPTTITALPAGADHAVAVVCAQPRGQVVQVVVVQPSVARLQAEMERARLMLGSAAEVAAADGKLRLERSATNVRTPKGPKPGVCSACVHCL